jgi:hypothetical protein
MKTLRHTARRGIARVLTGFGLTALAVQPLAAHAGPTPPVTPHGGTTMYVTYRVLPNGTRVPGSSVSTIVLLPGATDTLTAPKTLPGTTPETGYAFFFWDIDGHLRTQPAARFTAPAHQSSFAAMAWYVPTGCSGPCNGPTSVITYAFSLLRYRVMKGTPIASVAPSSAWTAPSSSVSTATAVTITAAHPLTFVRWLAPGATATGTKLAVGAGVSTIAMAFYGPNPCQTIQGEINNPVDPSDFPPPDQAKEQQAYQHMLELQLQACEARHGGSQ